MKPYIFILLFPMYFGIAAEPVSGNTPTIVINTNAPDLRIAAEPLPGNTLTLAFATEKKEFLESEPVILKYSLRNNSNKAIEIPLGWHGTQYFFFADSPDGYLHRNRRNREGGLMVIPTARLAPKDAYMEYVILDQWLHLKPGTNAVFGSLGVRGKMLQANFKVTIVKGNAEQMKAAAGAVMKSAVDSAGTKVWLLRAATLGEWARSSPEVMALLKTELASAEGMKKATLDMALQATYEVAD